MLKSYRELTGRLNLIEQSDQVRPLFLSLHAFRRKYSMNDD